MSKVVSTLNNLGLVEDPRNGTSLEILENINKLNLIKNANISQNYATELFLSLCFKNDQDVENFAKEFGFEGKFNRSTFFEEFQKVRMLKDKEGKDANNLKFKSHYYDLINSILKNNDNIVSTIDKYIEIPSIEDYLAVAKKENNEVKRNNANLDSEINDMQNVTGNELEDYSKFVSDNYLKQILNVSHGFKVRMDMYNSSNPNAKQLKRISKFKNIKSSLTARIVNKVGGKGYLSSPTKERKVVYNILDRRFFGNVNDENPKKLSFNEMLFYSVRDLNARALKYKKNYINKALYISGCENPTSQDVKLVTDLAIDLATRYMMFGLNLNNNTSFDPNVAFDYRVEKLFLKKLEMIEDKEDKDWLLPVVQELASNMATEFFKNAEITSSQVKTNIVKASKVLPEFRRDFYGKSYTGVLFGSETSTYNKLLGEGKISRLSNLKLKSKIMDKISHLTARNEKVDSPEVVEEETYSKPNQSEKVDNSDAELAQNGNTVKYNLFGREQEFIIYSFDEYCDNYVKNVLIPCSKEDGLVKAQEMYKKYTEIDDENLSNKDKLIKVMGRETLNKFYNSYVKYSLNEVNKRSAYCEEFVSIIREKLYTQIMDNVNRLTTDVSGNVEVNSKQLAKLAEFQEQLDADLSLSNIKLLAPLITVVSKATITKAKDRITSTDSELLDEYCKVVTKRDLDSYVSLVINNTMAIDKSRGMGIAAFPGREDKDGGARTNNNNGGKGASTTAKPSEKDNNKGGDAGQQYGDGDAANEIIPEEVDEKDIVDDEPMIVPMTDEKDPEPLDKKSIEKINEDLYGAFTFIMGHCVNNSRELVKDSVDGGQKRERGINKSSNTFYIMLSPKTKEDEQKYKDLQVFYDELMENYKNFNEKIESIKEKDVEDLTIYESVILDLFLVKNKYVKGFFSAYPKLDSTHTKILSTFTDEYINGINFNFSKDVYEVLRLAENKYLKTVNAEKTTDSGKNNATNLNTEKAKKARTLNSKMNQLVAEIIDLHIDGTQIISKDKNAIAYKELYNKAFKSVKRYYVGKGSEGAYKGISNSTVIGVKEQIDAYLKDLKTKIKAKEDFATLDIDAIIDKYVDYDELRTFIIGNIDNNIKALTSVNYVIDYSKRNVSYPNGAYVSYDPNNVVIKNEDVFEVSKDEEMGKN